MNFQLIPAVLLLVVIMCGNAWSATVTAYVAEFSVSGASKPDEMKTTLQALFLSRLASEKVTTQIRPEGAVIKVTGSYLLSGSVFSLDAVAVDNAGTVITRAFAEGKNPDELIPAVGTLAKLLSDGIDKATGSSGMSQVSVLRSDVVKPVRTVTGAGQVVLKIAGAQDGLALGRTFPDGYRELFVTGLHTLRYYRQGAELKLLAEIPYKVHEKVLAVDSADLDNNGIPEIYVTVMNGEVLVSQVWTVDGTVLKQIAGPLPYYFRTVTGIGGVKKLYAQQISGAADFYGDVSEVIKSGENYKLSNPVKLPKQGYLYNFNVLEGLKGEINPIIADRSGYLRVFNSVGDELWKSSEEYSGSESGFKRTDFDSSRNSGSGYRQVFLDQRLVIKSNGELLVPMNSSSWFMRNKHSYSRSSLYCFAWDGANLQEKWHTQQNDNYLADFAYDEIAHELIILEVVNREEGIFDKGASRLVIRKVD